MLGCNQRSMLLPGIAMARALWKKKREIHHKVRAASQDTWLRGLRVTM